MLHLRSLSLALVVVLIVPALGGCLDIVIPDDAIVACGKDGACPAGSSCNDDIDRCVPDDPVDDTAPVLRDISVDPPQGGRTARFTLRFSVDEALGRDPIVTVAGATVVKVAGDANDPATPWEFSFSVDGEGAEGGNDIVVNVIDVWGNARTQTLDDAFVIDVTAPVITDPDLDALLSAPALRFTLQVQGATRLRVSGDIEDEQDLVVSGASVDVDVVFVGGDGRKDLSLVASDDVGNTATLDLTFTLDSTLPFSRPVVAVPEGQTAIKDNDVVGVSGSVTPGATLQLVRLVDGNGNGAGTVSGVVVDALTGTLSGTINVGSLGAAASVRLEVIVVKDGVQSAAQQSRSNALVVDNVAPAGVTCSVPARTSSVNVTMTIGGTDFVDVGVEGDLVERRLFSPVSGGSVALVLTAGDGDKDLVATFRDGAHNTSTCAATTTLDASAPVITNVSVFVPGQTAVRSNQSATLHADVDVAGATVVSARLLDQSFRFLDDIDGVVVNGTDVDGSFVVSDLVGGAAGVTGLVVELVVEEGGLRSVATRSPQLDIDDVPPTDPVVNAPADAAGFFVDLDVAGCVGATEVAVSGDVATDAGVFGALPGDGVVSVVLTSGVGAKVLDVVCRDGAHNVSAADRVTINLTTDDVLSAPTLSPPAGQTDIKNGDTLVVGGAGEPGAVVTSVRLVDVATGNTARALAASSVTLTGTTLSGSVVASGLSNNQRVALEVILSARGRSSVAADSRSDALTVDLVVPVAPVVDSLRAVESSANANSVAAIADANNDVVIDGLAGAVVDAGFIDVCADAVCGTVIASNVAVNDSGGFASVDVRHRAAHEVFVRARDGADNRGSTTRVVIPFFSVPPTAPAGPSKAGAALTITFTTAVAAASGSASVVVDGNAATLQAQSGDAFTFRYVARGDEPRTAVVRASYRTANGSAGTAATTTTFDFTAPTIDANKITFLQSDEGTNDSVAGASGAVIDDVDTAVDVVVRGDSNVVVVNRVAAADGSFASASLGDNAVDVITVTATDDAGNSSTLTLANDRADPSLSSFSVSRAAAKDGDLVVIRFTATDASALRADPVVTVGGRAATRALGNRAESPLNEQFTYNFTVDKALDADGSKVVAVAAVDVHGNAVAVANAGSVVVDSTAPVLRNTTPGDRTSWNGAADLFGTVVDRGVGPAAAGAFSVRHCDTLAPCAGSVVDSGALVDGGNTRNWRGDVDPARFVDGDDYEATLTWADSVGNVATVVRAFTFDATPTPQPINLDAVAVDGDVLLTWELDPITIADSYFVYYDDDGIAAPPYNGTGAAEGDSPIDVGFVDDFVVTGLAPGDHVFVVTGVDGNGESAYSNEVVVTVP